MSEDFVEALSKQMNNELEPKVEEPSETDTARLKRILKEQVSFKDWASSLSHDFINLLTVISGYADLARCFPSEVVQSYERLEKFTHTATGLIEKYASRADSTRAKEKLLHVLNNALTPIYGCASMVKENPEKLSRYDKQISAGISRAVSIIRELQAFAHADSLLPKESINLLQLLELAFEENAGRHLNINRNYSIGSYRVSANQNELKRVYTCMIQNSIEAEADTLLATTYENAKTICIQLMDNGRGVDDKNIPHIFEPFYTTKYQNLGLSLATSKKIIEKYGGNIRFESKKWKGTAVTIEIPACK